MPSAPNDAAAGAVPNGDDDAASGAAIGAAKADAGAEAAAPKTEAGPAAAGAANDGGGAAASGAGTLVVGAPNGPAEGLGLKGEAADANGAMVTDIVEACFLPAAGCVEASGVGMVLASPDSNPAGATSDDMLLACGWTGPNSSSAPPVVGF